MSTIIVGLGHKARHGKDTAARFIHEAFPTETKLYSFAAGVRAVSRAVLGMEEKDGPLLQLVGTEVFRLSGPERDAAIITFINERKADWQDSGRFERESWKLDRLQYLSDIVGGDPDVWVRAVRHLIAEDNPRIAIITDMRFYNEVAITDETIKVTRLMPDGTPYVSPDRPADHPSEIALDDFEEWSDDITAKDGDLKGLRRSALSTFNQLMVKRGVIL